MKPSSEIRAVLHREPVQQTLAKRIVRGDALAYRLILDDGAHPPRCAMEDHTDMDPEDSDCLFSGQDPHELYLKVCERLQAWHRLHNPTTSAHPNAPRERVLTM